MSIFRLSNRSNPRGSINNHMPFYTFENTETGEQWTDMMSIADKEAYLSANPNIQQLFVAGLPVHDPYNLGRIKPDGDFQSRLKEIQKAHPKGHVVK